jgi:hypothetical protein
MNMLSQVLFGAAIAPALVTRTHRLDNVPPQKKAKVPKVNYEEKTIEKVLSWLADQADMQCAKEIAAGAGVPLREVYRALRELKDGRVFGVRNGISGLWGVRGVHGMQLSTNLQPAVREVLRPAGGQREAQQAAAACDAGADQIVSRKSSRVGDSGAGKSFGALTDRIKALELAIDVFAQSYGKRSEGAALEMLQDVRGMGK